MKQGGVLVAIATLLIVVWGNFSLAQEPEGACRDEREQWTDKVSALQECMEGFKRAKGKSLEPRIREELSSSETRTLARIVQTAVWEHMKKLAETRKAVIQLAGEESESFSDWKACISRLRGRTHRSAQNSLRTKSKSRRELLKKLDLMLLDPAYGQYNRSRP